MNTGENNEFWLNNIKYEMPTAKMCEYEYFKNVISNDNFKKEKIMFDFDIDPELVDFAHRIDSMNYCKLGIVKVIQIYDYLNYLSPVNFDIKKDALINHYVPKFYLENYEDNEFKIISELYDCEYGQFKEQLLHKYLTIYSQKNYICLKFIDWNEANPIYLEHNLDFIEKKIIPYETEAKDIQLVITSYLKKFYIDDDISFIFDSKKILCVIIDKELTFESGIKSPIHHCLESECDANPILNRFIIDYYCNKTDKIEFELFDSH